MIRVSIFYPTKNGARFDFDYYTKQHMPLSIRLLSAHPGFKGVSVERGIGGAAQGIVPAYIAMCHYQFDSTESFLAAFMPHAEQLQGDMANYTDLEPVIQFSEVLVAR